jgi:hypothetical protein
VTWEPGREKIGELLAAGDLARVPADHAIADVCWLHPHCILLVRTASHPKVILPALTSWPMTRSGKVLSVSCRPGAALPAGGGHIAVQEAVNAQFSSSVPVFRSFSRIRRARNSFEYPETDTAGPSEADVADAIETARAVRDAAGTILDRGILTVW